MDLRGMNLTRMAQSIGRRGITHAEFAEDVETEGEPVTCEVTNLPNAFVLVIR